MPTDFEEKYLLLRDENTALKKKKNEQEATIKRMFTKLAMIEEALKKKRQSEESDNQQDPETGGKAAIPVKRDLDTERFINALKNENLALRKKTQALQEKNRVLEETIRQFKLKPHLVRSAQALAQSSTHVGGLKSHGSGTATSKKTAPQQQQSSQSGSKARDFPGATLDAQVGSARKLHRDALSNELEHALKSRLVVAEKQLVKLQKENERLRRESGVVAKSRDKSNNNNDSHDDASSSDEQDETKPRRASGIEVEQLKRELRDRQAQLAILNARYDNLEANAAAEREIQEKTLEQMEAMNRQVHKLRTQLQDATMEHEHLEAKAARASELEKEIALVREQNHRLEERMTALCESPFINDAFQRKERIDKLFDLEKTCEQQKSMLSHLGDENQKLQVVNKELQSNLKLLKQAKDAIDQDMAKVRQHLAEERNARSVAAVRAATEVPASAVVHEAPPRPAPVHVSTIPVAPEKRDACSSPVRIDRAPLKQPPPHAMSSYLVVSRRYDSHALTVPPFVEGDESDESDTSIKHLRNRVHVLQMAHLRAMQELERCEKMLHAQTNINRELALEIEELTARKLSASSALQSKIKELALVAEERQQRIHNLEAQIQQLKYARAKLRQTAQFFDAEPANSSSSDDDDRDNASDVESVSESFVLAARDLAPGEQLLELVIISAAFDRSAVSGNSSTFVLCDFYDFESQMTPLVMGSRPEYSFSSTFRVTVDAFFLRYLASETLVLEVHQAQRGDFKLVGRALVRLSSLLRSRGVLREHTLPAKAVLTPSSSDSGDGNVMGTLNVVLRLSCPISEIWRLHLRSYPQDIQLLERERKVRAPAVTADGELVVASTNGNGDNEAGDDNDTMHRVNELQVAVLGCRNLRSYGKKKANNASLSRIPSSYVHYQLLGFPDAFTNIVAETAAPEYDLACSKQAYVLEIDACLLRFFSKFRLWLTVFDDQIELDGDSNDDGMIGRCGILLSDLADCKPIRGWFALRDRRDQPAGEISVAIQWKTSFDVLAILGYELIDVEKECNKTNGGSGSADLALQTAERSDADASATTTPQVPASADKTKPVNLDAEVLTDSKVPPKSMTTSRAPHHSTTSTEARVGSKAPSAMLPVATPVSAASEFQRRKDAFMERMKAIASASSKSLVYEELERKQMQQRLDVAAAAALRPVPSAPTAVAPPPIDGLAQQMQRLYAPQAIHHSAARTVQHTYRQYRAARVESEQTQRSASILDTDLQLQRLFKTWSSRELDALERQLIDKIEAAAAGATKTRTIARKQLGFIFMQTPQVALGPTLLSQLLAHFAVAPTNPKSLVAYRALVHFLCSVSTAERVQAHDAQHAVVPVVKSLCLSIPYARATFESVGDMKRTGAISLKRFRDALERLGVKLPAKDMRILVVLFDSNGAEVLYRAFLHMVECWSPASQRLVHVIQRCYAMGLSTLREKLIMHVPSEDGAMTKQDLQAVLTRESTDGARFDSQDAHVLFQMMTSDTSPDTRVAIHDFIVRLERSGAHSTSLEDDTSCYSMKQLRRLASNCRKLTCGSYSELVSEFERFDWREDDVVSLDVFVAVTTHHGFYAFTTLQLKQIAKCFGAKRNGRFAINYRQFLDWTTPSPGVEIAEIEAKLRAFAHAQAGRVGGKQVTQVLADWRHAFVAADPLHRGYLPRAEFLSVAKTALHVPLSDDELRVLLYSYDRSLEDQVDYDAFVQLNWSETTRAKQVRFEQPSVSASEQVQKIRTTFESSSSNESGAALLESFRDAADERSEWIDERAFTHCLKQLGVLLSPTDVRALFAAFGEPPDRNKLDYDAFVRKTLGLTAAKARSERVEHELTPADATRLSNALSTAIRASRDKVVTALQTLQEHCVVHRFGEVVPQVFWRLMDASGFVALVSRKAVGLLAQKFLTTYCSGASVSKRSRSATEEKEKEDDDERISLKAVYSYLQEVVQQQPSTKTPSATLQSTAPSESDRSDSASLMALRRLLASCRDTGVDVRGEFEKLDANYSGYVTAMELKQVVLGLGISKFVASDAAPESAIGQLVRQFRVPDARDAVSYTTMLYHALQTSASLSPSSELEWVVATAEHLRARIRRKAGLRGKLSADTHELCARLDACFAHFDRSHKGFITLEALHDGLIALQYDLTRPQVQQLTTCIGVFRTGVATLSRMEFDAFVLDPDAALVLERLAHDLLVVDTSRNGDAFPRIAQVSRALLARDSTANCGVVPTQAFWPSLEDALDRKLPQLTKRTLTLLFDVHRDAHIAYRLFLKVISQWQKGMSSVEDKVVVVASPVNTVHTAAATAPQCSRHDVLQALYHQLSSLDFNAQVAILHEHLRRKDPTASGTIAAHHLVRVFHQIGIALSKPAEASLLQLFAAARDASPASARVRYDTLIDALQEVHDNETLAHEDAEANRTTRRK